MVAIALAILALIAGVLVLVGSAALGTMTPHLVALAIIFLAVAVLLLAWGGRARVV